MIPDPVPSPSTCTSTLVLCTLTGLVLLRPGGGLLVQQEEVRGVRRLPEGRGAQRQEGEEPGQSHNGSPASVFGQGLVPGLRLEVRLGLTVASMCHDEAERPLSLHPKPSRHAGTLTLGPTLTPQPRLPRCLARCTCSPRTPSSDCKRRTRRSPRYNPHLLPPPRVQESPHLQVSLQPQAPIPAPITRP